MGAGRGRAGSMPRAAVPGAPTRRGRTVQPNTCAASGEHWSALAAFYGQPADSRRQPQNCAMVPSRSIDSPVDLRHVATETAPPAHAQRAVTGPNEVRRRPPARHVKAEARHRSEVPAGDDLTVQFERELRIVPGRLAWDSGDRRTIRRAPTAAICRCRDPSG